jgi:hypothetical protein
VPSTGCRWRSNWPRCGSIRLRMGDFAAARAELDRAEQDESQRGIGLSDMGAWLGLVRAELHWREGDAGATVRQCADLLAWLKGKQSGWWDGILAVVPARLALAVLAAGDEARCRALLADALQVAAAWVERLVLADVIDSIAVLTRNRDGFRDDDGLPDPVPCAARAKLAATLLGAAHSIRAVSTKAASTPRLARSRTRSRPASRKAGELCRRQELHQNSAGSPSTMRPPLAASQARDDLSERTSRWRPG